MQVLQSQVKRAKSFSPKLSSHFWQLKMAKLKLFGHSAMNNMLK